MAATVFVPHYPAELVGKGRAGSRRVLFRTSFALRSN